MIRTELKPGEAVEIFRHINSLEYTAIQKRLAIRQVSRMTGPALNKITKTEFIAVLRWEQGVQEKCVQRGTTGAGKVETGARGDILSG